MADRPGRRAILHIGTAKTGSTSIQALLAGSRAQLREQGFAYPDWQGRRNHLHLGVIAADDREAVRMVRTLGESGTVAAVRGRVAAMVAAEIAALPPGIHTVIFSSESLSDNVATAAGAARLKSLLDPWFADYRILVYLRRQDEFALSLYSTLLRGGATATEVLLPEAADARCDWAALLDRWAGAFGDAALRPRIFDRAAFLGGDLLADMRAMIGLGPLPLPPAERALNPSLTPPAQEFLRRYNLAVRPGGADAPETGGEDDPAGKVPLFIRQFLNDRFAGPGRRPSRDAARALVARHAAGNERIRSAYFPERPSLFADDFSAYPEREDPLPSGDAVAEVAVAVALAQAGELAAVQADVMARRARDRMREAPDEARRLFLRALGRRPGHAGALRGLLDLAADAAQVETIAQHLAEALAQEPDRPELRALRHRLGQAAARFAAGARAAPPEPAAPQGAAEARAARRAARTAAGDDAHAPGRSSAPRMGEIDRAARLARRAERQRRRDGSR